MIYKTIEELKDEKFQKWWARHPWKKVSVNNKEGYHRNILLIIIAASFVLAGIGACTEVMHNGQQNKKENSTNPDKQLKVSRVRQCFPLEFVRGNVR